MQGDSTLLSKEKKLVAAFNTSQVTLMDKRTQTNFFFSLYIMNFLFCITV